MAFRIYLCALLTLLVSSAPTLPAAAEAAQPQAIKDAAVSYLQALPKETKIYVWPTWGRPYEVLTSRPTISESVERYRSLRGGINGLMSGFWNSRFNVAQVSIIAVDGSNWRTSLSSSLKRSRLLKSYKEFVGEVSSNVNGCTAFRFIDRDIWATVGVILVNEKAFNDVNESELDRCLHSALDYVGGFPTKNDQFNYLTVPDAEVRRIVLEAIYECAADASRSSEERTRDGLTPLPSLDCITKRALD